MRSSLHIILILVLMVSSLSLSAQRTEKWCGEYIYYGSIYETPGLAKQKALERAQIQAVEEVFGLSVSQSNFTNVNNTNGNSSIDFTSIGGSDVNGEWIETIGEPEYDISVGDEFLVVKVNVCGRVREIVSAPIDFSAHLLRNGVEDKFEDYDYFEGDDLYLSFVSPVNGYLAVYLLDDDGEAYCLLPYSGMHDGVFDVRADKRYVLFSEKCAEGTPEETYVDELYLTCDKDIEHNQVYIIFSPNKFTKVNDSDGGLDATTEHILPRHLNNQNFHKWLSACRKHDKDMRADKRIITIRKTGLPL